MVNHKALISGFPLCRHSGGGDLTLAVSLAHNPVQKPLMANRGTMQGRSVKLWWDPALPVLPSGLGQVGRSWNVAAQTGARRD